MFELRKIGIVKRASAWLLDAILLAVLVTGIMWIVSVVCHFEEAADLSVSYRSEWYTYQKETIPGVADHYGFTYEATCDDATMNVDYTVSKDGAPSDLEALTGALVGEMARACGFTFTQREGEGYSIASPDGGTATVADVAEALSRLDGDKPEMAEAFLKYAALTPAETLRAQSAYVNSLLFTMVSVGLALSFLILEFIVPVCLKNGQTVGKKIFGICLVRPDCVRMPTVALFARTILGKFAIETMFPVLLVFLFLFGGLGILAIVLIAALFLLNAVLFFATKNRTPIHDVLAFTVAADFKEQMIFASEEERNEKKAELEKARVEREKSV